MGKIKEWIIKLVAANAAKKLKLVEGTPMENKKSWYQSKNVWNGIITVIVGAYEMVAVSLAPQFGWTIPPIPPIIFTILGALGIYTRVTATKQIA